MMNPFSAIKNWVEKPLTASVGVDVDDLKHYYRIHGLDESAANDAVWTRGLPRFLDLFADCGIEATFYCVAEDVESDQNRTILRSLVKAGHEIANHTWHHPYALTRLSDDERLAEVKEGKERLEAAAECPVVGFRSPGYHTSKALQDDLKATGHLYDSSIFPCAPYYLAKSGVLAWMALKGLTSHSIQGSPRVLLAPRWPYKPSAEDPFKAASFDMSDDSDADETLLPQYPVSVAMGCPLIGTAFTALGATASCLAVTAGLHLSRHITLEFHGIDLLDLGDMDAGLGAVQPDTRVPFNKKRDIFKAVIDCIKSQAEVKRLDHIAQGL